MRCRECAAEVAVTARVCSRCGAPIVGQPPVVADTVVAAISDEKVSGATLVDWAAWAASTTFSAGLGFGYDEREVDVFRSAVRDTFLGGAVFWVSTPPGEIR
jgi:hypothetical protein